nr:glycosyltransferase [Nocardiopsis dassonvillei]
MRAVLDQHCGTPLIAGGDGGYRVDLTEDQCDLLRFRSLVRRADGGADPSDRADLLISALGLWRGPVLADIVSPVLHERDVPPLNEELLRTAEEGFGAALARGDHERVADQIGPIATDHPEREPLIRVQMTALYRCGRPSEALRVYARTRDALAEHLGADPGRELQETFQGILRGDLDRAPGTSVPHQRASVEQGAGARPPAPAAGARPGPGTEPAAGLERIVAHRADVVLGVSGDLVRRLRSVGARDARLAVVAAPETGAPVNGREATRADLAVLPERPLLLTVARLAEQKGLDMLLAAAPAIADRRPEPVVAIAGDGPLWGQLHDTAAEMRADVRMLGHRADVADLLAAADVFCLTSQWEGPSLVIMEALRAGLPVVSTRVGGIPDLYSGTVLMVPPGDPAAFAAAVGRVLDDPALAEDLRARSREAAKALPSEEDAVEAAAGVYKAVLRR